MQRAQNNSFVFLREFLCILCVEKRKIARTGFMLDDKQKIRELIDTWMRASAAGDVSQLLGLMDEDVVFLLKVRADS